MKYVWYIFVGMLIYGSFKILYDNLLPCWGGDLKADKTTSLAISMFLLYGAYIIWDELIKK